MGPASQINNQLAETLVNQLTEEEKEAVRIILIEKKPISELTEEEKKALAQINTKATGLDIDPDQIGVLLAKFAGGDE